MSADLSGLRIFYIFVDFQISGVAFGVWEGLQSIGACSEIHWERFSAREVAYEYIFEYVHQCVNFPDKVRSSFGIVFIEFLTRSAIFRSYQLSGTMHKVALENDADS